jgi:hypothetical protein
MTAITPDTPLFKYLDFTELFYLIFNSKLYFYKATELTDANEMNFVSVNDLIEIMSLYKDNKIKEKLTKVLLPLEPYLLKLKSDTFVSCWSKKRDDYALWKIYTKGSKFGFCIETTFADLIDSINPKSIDLLLHDKVEYGLSSEWLKRYYQALVSNNMQELAQILCFTKSESYSYEEEYRLAVIKEDNDTKVIYQEVDLAKLIHYIHYSPFMPEWFKSIFNDIKDACFKRDISAIMDLFAPLEHFMKCADITTIKEKY